MFSVIIPHKYEDIIQPLLASLREYEPELPHIVIIADNHDRSYGFDIVKMTTPFNFSASVNAGIRHVFPNDIILLNDDITLLSPNTFSIMEQVANSDPLIGILGTLVDGGCGNLFMRASLPNLWEGNKSGIHYCTARGGDRVTFACVYIKNRLLSKTGPFDENFSSTDSYGLDDADMSIRCVMAGMKLAITNKVTIRHGTGGDKFIRGQNWNTSFRRHRGIRSRKNLNYLMSKYEASSMVRK